MRNSIIESIIVVSIMVAYIVYGIHFFPLLIPLTPIPFIVLGVRNGLNSNLLSIAAVSLIISILFDASSGISIILMLAPLSLALGYCINKRKSTMETILISTGAFFIAFIGLILLEGQLSGLNVVKQIEDALMETLSIQTDMFKELGMTNLQLLEARDFYENVYKTIIVLIPSLLILFSLIISYINFFVSSRILLAMGYGVPNAQKFSKFRLPNNIVPGIGVMLLLAFIFKWIDLEYNEVFLYNLTLLAGFAFFIQGLAVIDFLLIKAKVKKFFRIFLLVINTIFLPISTVLVVIGLVDTILDLRKIRRSKSL